MEEVTLGGSTAAIILPRLSHATVGMIASATYIDPQWDGVLQIELINHSPNVYKIEIGEPIAICRFYTVVGEPVPDSVRKEFVRKSHHFGLNWQKILDSDTYPQPLRKRALRPRLSDKLKFWLTVLFGNWEKIVGVGVLVIIFAGLLMLGQFKEKLENLVKMNERVVALEKSNMNLEEELTKMAAVGQIELEIGAGQQYVSKVIEIKRRLIGDKTAWVNIEPQDAPVLVSHSISGSSNSYNVFLTVTLDRKSKDTRNPIKVKVKWLVGSP